MQTQFDEKNRAALAQWGPRKILGALANVSSEEEKREFLERYGWLYPHDMPDVQIDHYAPKFRLAWAAKDLRDAGAVTAVNNFLNDIFMPDFLSSNPADQRPVMAADFAGGKWEPVPRNLLDVLARELLRCRKMLHRCEREECKRYMVKEFSRDRYCSRSCAEDMRSRKQSQWAEDHSAEIKRRRRKRSGK